MKHWMAVCAAALMATGISLANVRGHAYAKVEVTPGLPAGWASEGLVAGTDEVGVYRPRDGGQAELVITKRRDSPAGKPVTIYQTIDATPWRGSTIVFSFYELLHLEAQVMRRLGDGAVGEVSIGCDGSRPGSNAIVVEKARSRTWLESNLRLNVPEDATRCSLGVTLGVEGQLRLSRVRLKDHHVERRAQLAKRWPDWDAPVTPSTVFTAVKANTPILPQPNLEFKQ